MGYRKGIQFVNNLAPAVHKGSSTADLWGTQPNWEQSPEK